MSRNFLSCLKGVKDLFGAQVGRWDFSRDPAVETGLSSRLGVNLLAGLKLRPCSSQVMTGTSGTRSWCLREIQSPHELRGAPPDSSAVAAGARLSSGVEAGTSGFLSRADKYLGVPLGYPQGSHPSSCVEP